ncbi:MAG: NAD(P)-binding domain-containing protein [Chloroflexi bacterium]|nr:NAD(P)-binding domain-containing protein [Chloroflexota bacterium]
MSRKFDRRHLMRITIIGNGKMARGIGTRVRAGGHALTILGQDSAKANQLAAELGAAAAPLEPAFITGEVVVLALPYRAALEVATRFAPALANKVVVDISNPLKPTYDGLAVSADTSAAEELQKLLAGKALVVKAFNTAFASTLVEGKVGGQVVDVFVAGDDARAKEQVLRLANDGGLHGVDVGPLARARQLEHLALLGIMLQQQLGTAFNTGWKLQLPL